jgi:hypothetical protein
MFSILIHSFISDRQFIHSLVKTNASKNLTSRVTVNGVEVGSAMTKRAKKSGDKADAEEEVFDVIFTPPSEGATGEIFCF